MSKEQELMVLETIREWVEYHECSVSVDDEMQLKEKIKNIFEK